jgi:hypothetical protein
VVVLVKNSRMRPPAVPFQLFRFSWAEALIVAGYRGYQAKEPASGPVKVCG